MPASDELQGILNDLTTITDVARAGVVSRNQVKLVPGETRPAAIVFLDVVGFTGLARKLDSETLARLIDSTFRIFELSIRSYGGYCDKVIGDAGLYIFAGHPNHPPAGEAALLAALALLKRAEQIGQTLKSAGLSLAVRIGASFGEVTRLQQVGGSSQQATVMGEVVNLAQRLQTAAEPGQVLVTSRVLEQAGDRFRTVPVGEVELKGFGRVHTHQLLEAIAQPVRLRTTSAKLSPFVGRSALITQGLNLMQRWLADFSESAPRLLAFCGPAAMGKSRLVYELLAQLKAEREISSALVQCDANGSVSSLAQQLCQLAGITADNLHERWTALTVEASPNLPAARSRQLPAMLPLLAHLVGSTAVDTSGVDQANPQAYFQQLTTAVAACIELAGLVRPVVLVLEDLQWLGDARQFLQQVLQITRPLQPWIVIVTTREEADRTFLQDLVAETHWSNLPALEAADCRALYQALLPGLTLPAQFEAALLERAQGLPYYIEEFARMLVRRELVKERQGRYQLEADLHDVAIPESVHMLVLGRIDQLEPELKEVASHAAILGRSFLKRVLLKIETLLHAVEEGALDQTLHLLTQTAVLRTETQGTYYFEHLLTREAIYRSILRANRVALHRLAAEACAELMQPGTLNESAMLRELAYHLESSQQPLAAHRACCTYLDLLAGCGAMGAWEEWEQRARANWEKARAVNSELAAVSARLQYAQATRAANQGRTQDALVQVEAIFTLLIDQPEVDQLALHNLHGRLQLRLGQMEQARATWESALALAAHQSDARAECALRASLGSWHQQTGELATAREYFQQALAIARALGRLPMQGVILNNLATVGLRTGDYASARELWEEALQIQRSIFNRQSEATILHNMGCMLEEQGEHDQALAIYREELALFESMGYVLGQGAALNNIGSVLLKQGNPNAAIDMLRKAQSFLEQVDNQHQLAFVLCDLARCYAIVNEINQAHQILAEAWHIAEILSHSPGSELANYIVSTQTYIDDQSCNLSH